MRVHCYWDREDDPRAQCDPPYELLAGFLESDIQGSAVVGREILQAIDRVMAGEQETWQDTGNAYTLTLSAQEASIEAEAAREAASCQVSLADLREAVAQWLAFIESGA